VLLKRDDQLLFVLREHTGFMDGTYSLPAGHVERGESFSQAAARETLEEVGVRVRATDLKQVFTMHRFQSDEDVRVDVFFEASKWQGELSNAEPERHSKIQWMDIGNLSDDVMDYQLHALKQILAGNTYAERGWKIDKTD
jgi:ADP-ribose pyrophosphatase YjhB (NUDIX family)